MYSRNGNVLSGVFAAQPSAVAMPAGTMYFATDTLNLYVLRIATNGARTWQLTT